MTFPLYSIVFFFFFFSSRRRHTRYIGDWSSDVCSSDLGSPRSVPRHRQRCRATGCGVLPTPRRRERHAAPLPPQPTRSEERRVGKECRSRGTADESKRNRDTQETAAEWRDGEQQERVLS